MDAERRSEISAIISELTEEGDRQTKGSPTCTVCGINKVSEDVIQVHVHLRPDIGPLSSPRLIVTGLDLNPVDEVQLEGISDHDWVGGAQFLLPPMAWREGWPDGGPAATYFFIEVDHHESGQSQMNGPYMAES